MMSSHGVLWHQAQPWLQLLPSHPVPPQQLPFSLGTVGTTPPELLPPLSLKLRKPPGRMDRQVDRWTEPPAPPAPQQGWQEGRLQSTGLALVQEGRARTRTQRGRAGTLGAAPSTDRTARLPSLALPAPLAQGDTAQGLLPALWDPHEPLELEATGHPPGPGGSLTPSQCLHAERLLPPAQPHRVLTARLQGTDRMGVMGGRGAAPAADPHPPALPTPRRSLLGRQRPGPQRRWPPAGTQPPHSAGSRSSEDGPPQLGHQGEGPAPGPAPR